MKKATFRNFPRDSASRRESRQEAVGWLVGWLFLGLLWDSSSVYFGPSLTEGERKEKRKWREKMSKPPPPAGTESAIGPCPTIIKLVGRPALKVYPAPSHHPISPSKTTPTGSAGRYLSRITVSTGSKSSRKSLRKPSITDSLCRKRKLADLFILCACIQLSKYFIQYNILHACLRNTFKLWHFVIGLSTAWYAIYNLQHWFIIKNGNFMYRLNN